MAYNTGNPIGSTDPRDLSDNAQNFDEAINERAAATWTDRLGVARKTVWGAFQDITYKTPVSYATGLSFLTTDANKTVEESGVVYAPLNSALPFTTSGTFAGDDDARFYPVQDKNNVIRVTSIAAMEAYSAPVGYVFSLNAGGRSGTFDVVAGDFSSELSADTLNGVYIGLADDTTGASKVAKRRIADGVYVRWFGPTPNTPSISQLSKIQSAVDVAGEGAHVLIDEPYYIDATENAIFQSYGGVIPKNFQTIEFLGKGELIVITTADGAYSCFQGYNLDGVTLLRPKLTGDTDAHTGTTGEFGHGVFFLTCYNIKILDGHIKDMWGDGLTPSGFETGSGNAGSMPGDYVPGPSENWLITGNRIHNCGRQGISVIGLINFTISDNIIYDIRRTSPSAGIDCEPNSEETTNKNGSIVGNSIYNCKIGIMTTGRNDGITITGNTIALVDRGLQLQGVNITASGNAVSVTVNAASLLSGCLCIGSVTNANINGNSFVAINGTESARFISEHTPPVSAVIKGNTFYTNDAVASSTIPNSTNNVDLIGNTFTLGSTYDNTNATSRTVVFCGTNTFVDGNIIKNESAIDTEFFDAFSGRIIPQKGFNRYFGTFSLTGGGNAENLINTKVKRYTMRTTGGINNSGPFEEIKTLDISDDFEGLDSIIATISYIGTSATAADRIKGIARLREVSDTGIEVIYTSDTAAYQNVMAYITVSGEGRSS